MPKAISLPNVAIMNAPNGVFAAAITATMITSDAIAGHPAHSHLLGHLHAEIDNMNTGTVTINIPTPMPKVIGSNEFMTAAYPVRPPAITVIKYARGMI